MFYLIKYLFLFKRYLKFSKQEERNLIEIEAFATRACVTSAVAASGVARRTRAFARRHPGGGWAQPPPPTPTPSPVDGAAKSSGVERSSASPSNRQPLASASHVHPHPHTPAEKIEISVHGSKRIPQKASFPIAIEIRCGDTRGEDDIVLRPAIFSRLIAYYFCSTTRSQVQVLFLFLRISLDRGLVYKCVRVKGKNKPRVDGLRNINLGKNQCFGVVLAKLENISKLQKNIILEKSK